MAWADRPTAGRLALFYAVFALGFGNHLSMVLLLPAFTVFLLMHRRPGAADPLRPRMLIMAVAIAALGALQYAWNFRGLWAELEPPASLAEALAKFWFDVTKAGLARNARDDGLRNRAPVSSGDVLVRSPAAVRRARRRARSDRLLLRAVALAAARAFSSCCSMRPTWRSRGRTTSATPTSFFCRRTTSSRCAPVPALRLLAAFASRVSNRTIASGGERIAAALSRLARVRHVSGRRSKLGRSCRATAGRVHANRHASAVYGVDTNWQVQNAFEYFMRERKPGVPWFYTEELEWLTGNRSRRAVRRICRAQRGDRPRRGRQSTGRRESHGPASVTAARRRRPSGLDFSTRVESVRPGTPYVLAVLRADREYSLEHGAARLCVAPARTRGR